MNLITAHEVLVYSPAGAAYPTSTFCDLIPQIEEAFARECLGNELYEYFVAALKEYPAGVKEWEQGCSYKLAEVVIFNGCLWESTKAMNQTHPINGAWERWERFDNEDVNEFWAKYLRGILAFKVYMASLVYTTWGSGATGITVTTSDNNNGGKRSANKGEMIDLKNSLFNQIDLMTNNMRAWLKKNGKDAGFPIEFVCGGGICPVPRRSVRRWAFKSDL